MRAVSDAKWQKAGARSMPHWLELQAPDGWWYAALKSDGCIHLYHAGNDPFGGEYGGPGRTDHDCDDYLHICDLNELIERLQALREKAREHFGDGWPE